MDCNDYGVNIETIQNDLGNILIEILASLDLHVDNVNKGYLEYKKK